MTDFELQTLTEGVILIVIILILIVILFAVRTPSVFVIVVCTQSVTESE